MKAGMVPVVLNGALAQLFPDLVTSLTVRGPGWLGKDGAAAAMLFDAGNKLLSIDLFGGFWRDDAAGMDWLNDFLCDSEIDRLIALLRSPEEDEESEEEILYSRSQLATVGSEVVDS